MESPKISDCSLRIKCAFCAYAIKPPECVTVNYKAGVVFGGTEVIPNTSFTLVLCKECAMRETDFGGKNEEARLSHIKRTFYCYHCGNRVNLLETHLCPQTHFKFDA